MLKGGLVYSCLAESCQLSSWRIDMFGWRVSLGDESLSPSSNASCGDRQATLSKPQFSHV